MSEEKKILGDGVTVEKMTALYFDQDALQEPLYKAYRMNNKGQRWYYRTDTEKPTFYMSVTSVCYATLPTSPYLIKWIAELGQEAARAYSELKAHYGTLLHSLCAKLLIAKEIDLDIIDTDVSEYARLNGLTADNVSSWPSELRKDVLAFGLFVIETNFKPVAVEVVLTHPDGYAGAIDIVGDMDVEDKGFFGEVYKSGVQSGQPKESKRTIRVLAIVDIKSGKKGFYESHEIQLHLYKNMWNHNYPSIPVDRVYNWAPSDWREKPSYKLKEQTNAPNAYKLPYIIGIAKEMRVRRETTVMQITGTLSLSKGIERNYSSIGFDELVTNQEEEITPELELFTSEGL